MIVDLDTVSLAPSTDVSKWNAVRNPIVYRMQRMDFVFDQVNNNGGFVQLQFNAIDLTGSFAVDDEIYFQSDNSIYDSFGSVTAESFSTNTLITLDVPYVSAAPGGFINNDTLRPSYRIEVEVYNSSNVIIGNTHIWSPTNKGAVLVDVSEILSTSLSYEIEMDISVEDAVVDSNCFIQFYIKYREVWEGSAESQVDDVLNQFFAVLAGRQIPAPYGGNMYEYVTFVDGSPLAKFLTKLTRPKMWRDFPFLISAIAGDMSGGNVLLNIRYYDISGALISSTDSVTINEKRVAIFNVADIIAIPDNAVRTVLLLNKQSGPLPITEELTCDIVEPCANPILLVGRNSLGGILEWMFDVSQDYTFDYGDGRKAKRLVLTAVNLTINEWEALQEFITLGEVYKENILELTEDTNKTSVKIDQQLYVVSSDGSKIGVVAIPTKNRTFTKNIKHVYELEIEYPEEF